jgi:hypothetical protein
VRGGGWRSRAGRRRGVGVWGGGGAAGGGWCICLTVFLRPRAQPSILCVWGRWMQRAGQLRDMRERERERERERALPLATSRSVCCQLGHRPPW